MSWERLKRSLIMILRMTLRRRIIMVLFIAIPTVFSIMVYYTTSEREMPFRLASVSNEVFLEISEQSVSILFMLIASAGFISSFLALNLIQKNRLENRRLILCGYHPSELVISNLSVLIVSIVFIALYTTLISSLFFESKHYMGVLTGICLAGFIYGAYGLVVGSLIKGELEGILFIVLLANIDAGWLQNPLFYADAQNKEIIEFLPAFYPSQTAIASAFSDYSIASSILWGVLYGMGFLILAMVVFFYKMKKR